jgi:hypothetical protein
MNVKIKYEFSAKIWQYQASGSWYFVSLPNELSAEIRNHAKWQEQGWGRLKATAKIGANQWETAIWYDTKHLTYLLPVKAEIRKKENIEKDSLINCTIWI